MGVEEFLDMPPLGKILSQRFNFVAVRRREERFEVVFFGPLPLALNVLVERPRLAPSGPICKLCGRVACLARLEHFERKILQFLSPARLIGHRYQELKVRLTLDVV
jgi:hypothetical protein